MKLLKKKLEKLIYLNLIQKMLLAFKLNHSQIKYKELLFQIKQEEKGYNKMNRIISYFMRQIISVFCHIHSYRTIDKDFNSEYISLSFKELNEIKILNLFKSEIK